MSLLLAPGKVLAFAALGRGAKGATAGVRLIMSWSRLRAGKYKRGRVEVNENNVRGLSEQEQGSAFFPLLT